MVDKNKTKYAVLGVLSLKAGTGYDIKKFCDKTISHYWHENFGNIYPMLSQLEQEGMIAQEHADGAKMDRKKCYRLTDSGKQEFHRWLMQPVEYRPARSELLLKLSFANQIPMEITIEMLKAVRKKHTDDLKQYKMLEASFVNDEEAVKHPQYPYWLAPLRYGIEITQTVIRWCDDTIESIQSHRSEA